jgi:hypothetical protein
VTYKYEIGVPKDAVKITHTFEFKNGHTFAFVWPLEEHHASVLVCESIDASGLAACKEYGIPVRRIGKGERRK